MSVHHGLVPPLIYFHLLLPQPAFQIFVTFSIFITQRHTRTPEARTRLLPLCGVRAPQQRQRPAAPPPAPARLLSSPPAASLRRFPLPPAGGARPRLRERCVRACPPAAACPLSASVERPNKMAASETVRLRLQFDYPPPNTPSCTTFWLLVDLSRCRVVTDLLSLIRQRFGFSSGAPLGLYLAEGLLPPGESARVVRDNDSLSVKLENRGVPENPAVGSCDEDAEDLPKKSKKRTFKLEEDEETELGYKNSKKHWKRQNSSARDCGEPRTVTDQSVRTKIRRKVKATCQVTDDEEETKRKSPKKKQKRQYRKQTRISKSSKALLAKEWTLHKAGAPKGTAAKNKLAKTKRSGDLSPCPKGSTRCTTDSESCNELASDGQANVSLGAKSSAEKVPPAEKAKDKDVPATKKASHSKVAAQVPSNANANLGKRSRSSSSCSDLSSGSEDQCAVAKSNSDGVAGFLKTVGLFVERSCLASGPTASSQAASAAAAAVGGCWKFPDSKSNGRLALGAPDNDTLLPSLTRGWGRGKDLSPWKTGRGRGGRGRGRGRGQTGVLSKSVEYHKQKQLSEMLTNASMVIQNPEERQKKDYTLLPLLAAAPQVGEKIAFKLLELTSSYSPDVSDYKEGKILSHNPETQQVDIEILSSLPALKEPGKFDLVYHNENGTEVVEYAVTQEKRISVLWRELIDPRLIIESSNNIPAIQNASIS